MLTLFSDYKTMLEPLKRLNISRKIREIAKQSNFFKNIKTKSSCLKL